MFTFSGSIALISGSEVPDITPSLNLRFQLSGYTASGVRVHRVDCYGEVSAEHPFYCPAIYNIVCYKELLFLLCAKFATT